MSPFYCLHLTNDQRLSPRAASSRARFSPTGPVLHKDIADQINSATPFRNPVTFENTASVDALQKPLLCATPTTRLEEPLGLRVNVRFRCELSHHLQVFSALPFRTFYMF